MQPLPVHVVSSAALAARRHGWNNLAGSTARAVPSFQLHQNKTWRFAETVIGGTQRAETNLQNLVRSHICLPRCRTPDQQAYTSRSILIQVLHLTSYAALGTPPSTRKHAVVQRRAGNLHTM